MELTDSVSAIKGIGEKTQKLFGKLGINSVGELLTYYPARYDTFKDPGAIAELKPGEDGVICGLVSKVVEPRYASRIKVLTCIVTDPSGSIELVWFNQPYVKYELKSGYHFIFRGKVNLKGRKLQMEQAKVYKREEYYRLQTALQPVYRLTSGLTNNALRKAMQQALTITGDLPEYVPLKIRKKYEFLKKNHAVTEMHFPKSYETMVEARRSLVFEEFFLFMVFLREMALGREEQESVAKISDDGSCDDFIRKLPYSLTEDQAKVFEEVRKDMTSGRVMARLIQGDVGSGKTVIAELALLMTARSGYQGAIMAPTEVLAKQHYDSMSRDLKQYGINCVLLVGSQGAAEKKKIYRMIAAHEADVVIGTHTLFQEKLEFDNLALCITDEQHRFGVRQRENLSKKGIRPHILVMSATPIPRTLAMMMYGDMDISRITTMPAERLPVKNCVVGQSYRNTAYNFIKKQVDEGRQAYVICPMVDGEEDSELQNVTDYTESLKTFYGDSVSVEKLHGKMKAAEKNDIMERFKNGEIRVLVSTTVVEVGVNVPNATVMMVEDAERFGLAQLHQLRGRVGRGDKQSYCIFICGKESEEAMERLNILLKSNNGFDIANEDLKMRGPGDLFGIRQCGEMYFKLGDVFNDAEIMNSANEAVASLSDRELEETVQKMYDGGAKEVFQFFNNYVTI
ncbi:MAG: ATP-dependent DNA helicase RecG [Lachnospiraceae bacterium]|nr:ATP-dependent DNA helicase RecG [Lachnospiraceae bacterium]